MSRVSLVVNADTRPPKAEVGDMFDGTRSEDYLIDGVKNKQEFFRGHDIETILWVDEHLTISHKTYERLHDLCDRLVISKHSKAYRSIDPFSGFNDVNYLQALSLARGDYIAHFDQDMAAYTSDKSHVDNLIQGTHVHQFICYPSHACPRCVSDPSFGSHVWASTRFFLCKKEAINLTELEQAIMEPETLYAKYGHPARIMNWTEHFLGVMAKGSVYYPILSNNYLIFPWHKYADGTLAKLHNQPFHEIAPRLIEAGAHSYHGVDATKL